MFIGEGPGADEDLQGEPFVGRAGELLTRLLKEFGVARDQVYIANIVKCRPPGNRTPALEEIRSCIPYLFRQIRTIQPKMICALGNVAAGVLLNTKQGITSLRGRVTEFNNMKVFCTFHPAYILRNMSQLPILKRDVRQVLREVGLGK
jgi:DNA polymerase